MLVILNKLGIFSNINMNAMKLNKCINVKTWIVQMHAPENEAVQESRNQTFYQYASQQVL